MIYISHIRKIIVSIAVVLTAFFTILDAESLSTVMRWQDAEQKELLIKSPLNSKDAKSCLDAGLNLEHRFLVKFCENLNGFGTQCESIRRVINTFSYDPVQDAYDVMKDHLGDTAPPLHFSHSDFQDAVDDSSFVSNISLEYLRKGKALDVYEKQQGRWNIGVRVQTTCKGDVPKFLAAISYVLSFGLVDLYGDDTGWEYFQLTSKDSSSLNSSSGR